MKVLIHALGVRMGGARRHLENFIPELSRVATGHRYKVLLDHKSPHIDGATNVEVERGSYHRGPLGRIWFDLVVVPRLLSQQRFDGIVSLTNFGPVWSPVPHLLFQRNALYYWPAGANAAGGREKFELILRRRLAYASMRRAAKIVTPSGAMAALIQEMYPSLKPDRFFVLYHGFDAHGMGNGVENTSLIDDEANLKILLYPTHAARHKGFDILFSALAELKRRGARFRLYTTVSRGDGDWISHYERQVADLGLCDEVRFLGTVPQQNMGALYRRADLMVYPSLCEAFGFSMLEALGTGLPIVAADTAVNREICGEAALFYPPRDAKAASAIIEHALRDEVSEKLRACGTKRFTSYDWSWSRYACEFHAMVQRDTRSVRSECR